MIEPTFAEPSPTPAPAGAMDGARANFRIGEAFPATDRYAGFVVRLAMARHDMLVNYDLVARAEIKGPTRLWLIRVMVAQIREATRLVAPPDPHVNPHAGRLLSAV